MRRKRRRPERAEEERQLMSNSLLDDLITPSHLATGVGWGGGGDPVSKKETGTLEKNLNLSYIFSKVWGF